jgi:hypothetical protein
MVRAGRIDIDRTVSNLEGVWVSRGVSTSVYPIGFARRVSATQPALAWIVALAVMCAYLLIYLRFSPRKM